MNKEEIRQKYVNMSEEERNKMREAIYKKKGRNEMVYKIADLILEEKYLKEFYGETKEEILEEMKTIKDPNFQDDDGFSYLHTACQTHCVEAIKILLELGADPNITDKRGAYPVLSAIGSINENNPQILELMLQHNLNLDAPVHNQTLKEHIERFDDINYNEVIKKYYKK